MVLLVHDNLVLAGPMFVSGVTYVWRRFRVSNLRLVVLVKFRFRVVTMRLSLSAVLVVVEVVTVLTFRPDIHWVSRCYLPVFDSERFGYRTTTSLLFIWWFSVVFQALVFPFLSILSPRCP